MQKEQLEQLEREVRTFAVTNYILKRLRRYSINDITNLKLQKILYLAYGLHLCLYDEDLFNSPIQAWRLGPVVPDVYKEFKDFGNTPITTSASILKDDNSGEVYFPDLSEEFEKKAIDIACTAYGQKQAWNLVDITHDENSAWKKNYREGKNHIIIPKEDVRAELQDKLSGIAKYLSQSV